MTAAPRRRSEVAGPHAPVPALEAVGIVKAFPGVLANDHVDFDVRTGEIHALLGENGAGKSTLMNILAGLYRPDEGEIRLDGRPMSFGSPRDAIDAGHRHGPPALHARARRRRSPRTSCSASSGRDSSSTRAAPRRRWPGLAAEFGLRVHPSAKIWQLSVGEQQRVEILKLLYRGARILIMDEPTAVLAPQETEDLFRTLRAMADAGRSVVFISHKLNEVVAIADRVTVMRRGRVTAAGQRASGRRRSGTSPGSWSAAISSGLYDRTPFRPGRRPARRRRDVEADERPRAARAARRVARGAPAARSSGSPLSPGNGQAELAEVITGLRPCRGSIRDRWPGRSATDRRATRSGPASPTSRRTGPASAAPRTCRSPTT